MDIDRAELSPTQRHVLETLKRQGEATADELADSLEISSSAVRQHLGALRSAGFVASRHERGNAGRPADRYHATELTERLFAATANDLAVEILGHIEEEDAELIDRIFERRRHQQVDALRDDVDGLSLGERVALLADRLDAQGYLADFEQVGEDRYRLNLHSCAIWAVASRYRQACGAELGFIEALVPNATVSRVMHKTAGAHTCAYEIAART
jgi:predicted ArsR family transcriptional regulator